MLSNVDHVHGGASGGPVFGADGRVFGINSTGWDQTALSYVSRINELLDLELPSVEFPPGSAPRAMSLRELAKHDLISLL